MSMILTPEQEQFIQSKLQTGKYRNAQEVLELAFKLLDEYEQADTDWINSVREKIDAAICQRHDASRIAISEQTPPIDGKAFVGQILKDLQQVRERQE
ncbi:MAG: type II toxin-antitoxin system ParD family antitoxin [Cyanobacteria bacterium P01_A01_bin.84]